MTLPHNFKKILMGTVLLALSLQGSLAQEDDLEKKILEQDRQLFKLGFNQCDFAVWDRVFAKEFEFYDDRSGLNEDRQREVDSFKDRCENAPGLKRRLLNSRVSPLGSDRALQLGEHEFVLNGKTVERAKFIHIWQFLDNEWIVSRVISYDHDAVEPMASPR